MTVTDHNALVKQAVLNIQYFTHPNPFGDIMLKGCKNCNKLVKYNHTVEPRFRKQDEWVYVCECSECKTPMLLNNIDFYLLNGKV